MSATQLLEKLKTIHSQKIGKVPVVILPLKDWQKFEEMVEEYTMSHSKNFLESVKKARRDIKRGKLYRFNLQTGNFRKANIL